MQSLNAIGFAIFQVYVAMLNRMRTSASRQITRINATYEKIKQSNQADLVPPNWSLPLSEEELKLDTSNRVSSTYGFLNGEPVYSEWDGPLSLLVTNGTNSIDLASELIATYPRLFPPASYGPTPVTRRWVHPDGVVVRVDGADTTLGSSYRKGLLIYLDSSLSIDSVVELWETDNWQRSVPDNFLNVCAVMSTEGTTYCVVRNRKYGTPSYEQFSTMQFDGSSYKYSVGINWTYDGSNYSLRNGFLLKDSTIIYTGFYPIVDFIESASPSIWAHPMYPVYVQFDGSFVYWALKPTGGAYTYVKRLEVA